MGRNTGKRLRLTIDVPPELRRRIKIAAAERDQSIRDYMVAILEGAVPREERRTTERGRVVTTAMIDRLRQLKEETMQGRTFSVDSAELIEQARAERTEEL